MTPIEKAESEKRGCLLSSLHSHSSLTSGMKRGHFKVVQTPAPDSSRLGALDSQRHNPVRSAIWDKTRREPYGDNLMGSSRLIPGVHHVDDLVRLRARKQIKSELCVIALQSSKSDEIKRLTLFRRMGNQEKDPNVPPFTFGQKCPGVMGITPVRNQER
jgi:hypothetical protein